LAANVTPSFGFFVAGWVCHVLQSSLAEMSFMRVVRILLFSLLLVLLDLSQPPVERTNAQSVAPATAPPAASQPTAQAPTLQVYSRETVVDISVTDDKGNPVHGLTRNDFTVLEDKKPQPIRSFQEFGSEAPPQPLPKLPPHVYTNAEPPQTNPALNIILLDGLNTAPPDGSNPREISQSFFVQTRVEQGAHKYLASAPPGSRFAVLNLTNHLRILQSFTSSSALLSASVDTMQMDMDGHAETLQNGMSPLDAENVIEAWKSEQNSRNRATLEALNQIAADFINVKGKKNLFWFSAGFPSLVTQNVNSPTTPTNYGLPDYSQDLHKTYALLQAAQVIVYPIAGNGVGMPISAPYGGASIDPGFPGYLDATSTEMLSLEQLAEATGGKAFYNSNDLAGLLGKAVADASDYYTISYAPPGTKFDGRHHSIHIEVDKPGLHMTYRDQYWAEDPSLVKPKAELELALALAVTATAPNAADTEAAMHDAMIRAMPLSTDMLLDVQVEPTTEPARPGDPATAGKLDPKYKDKPLTRYGFTFIVPGKEITVAAGPNFTHSINVEMDVSVWDGDAKLVTSAGQAVKAALNSQEQVEELSNSPFRAFQPLDLPSGTYFLRFGVLDRDSGKIGTLEIPLTVPKK
jgi:VWFA-related protein